MTPVQLQQTPEPGEIWCGHGEASDRCVVVLSARPGKRIRLERLTGSQAGRTILVALDQLHAAFRPDPRVSCLVCDKLGHPANMCKAYEGEYFCQECRWGL